MKAILYAFLIAIPCSFSVSLYTNWHFWKEPFRFFPEEMPNDLSKDKIIAYHLMILACTTFIVWLIAKMLAG